MATKKYNGPEYSREVPFTPEELAAEEWRVIPGWDGLYSASNLGRIRRDAPGRNGAQGRIMKGRVARWGYALVFLTGRDGTGNGRGVHRLVMMAFGYDVTGLDVDHLDSNRQNNRLSNLEVVTHAENQRRAKERGRMATGIRTTAGGHPEKLPRGEAHHKTTLTADQVREIRRRKQAGERVGELAREFQVRHTCISRICSGVRWQHVDAE